MKVLSNSPNNCLPRQQKFDALVLFKICYVFEIIFSVIWKKKILWLEADSVNSGTPAGTKKSPK